MERETEIVLANLDHLIYHHGMRLDYGSRAVLTLDGDVAYTLDDLAVPALTPAGQRLAGRLPIQVCYTDATSSPIVPDSPERIAAISRARHPDTADGAAG
jgi:hypothetical protein